MIAIRSGLAGMVLIVGCNSVFGLQPTLLADAAPPAEAAIDADVRADLDHDGIPDVDDPCIAPGADALFEQDGDGVLGDADSCPFDKSNGGDVDGDLVSDACDPFINLGGDHHRCTMQFQDNSLNTLLWQPRGNDPHWTVTNEHLASTGPASATLIATETLEAPTVTTFDVIGTMNLASGSPTGTFQLWLRASDAGSPSDVGCELSGDNNTGHVTILGTSVAMTFTAPIDTVFRMRATIEPNAAVGVSNMRCEVTLSSFAGTTMPTPIAAAVALPAGHVALTSSGALVTITGIATYDRADAPALP